MNEIFIAIGLCLLSYVLGCFSAARVLGKRLKNLNIYKVGTGLAETHNIYSNISKPLGVLVATIDMSKMIIYIWFLKLLLLKFDITNLLTNTMLFVFGFFVIAGHCLPVNHKFKGGRGVVLYVGLMLFIIPNIMVVIFAIGIIIGILFKQIRFSQYLVVLLPPIICFFLPASMVSRELNTLMVVSAFIMGVFNYIVSKRLGEF